MRLLCAIAIHALILPNVLLAQTSTLTSEEHCEAVALSVAEAGFTDEAKVTCDNGSAYIISDSYPSHPMMTGIIASNEQIPVPAEGYFASVVLNPVKTNTALTRDSSLAIAVNGIPIFDYTSGGELSQNDLLNHQPHLDTVILNQLDECGGHTGRGDDYHYHEKPRCMIDQMNNKGDDAIIGWAFDGFPLYGDNNPDGTAIANGALDICNGQPDPVFGYRYHTSNEPPYIVQCLFGQVGDLNALPRIGTTRPPGMPINVSNMVFTEQQSGLRQMTYNFQGQPYYINYTPTGTTNCYNFESRTFNDGGALRTGIECVNVVSGLGVDPITLPSPMIVTGGQKAIPAIMFLLQ